MRKNIIKMIIFCSGLVVIFFGLGFMVKPTAKDYDTGLSDVMLRSVTYEKENTLDAVFLGDSVVYASVIPLQIWQQHGIATYVGAAPGQAVNGVADQLEMILEKQKPKVVFYETNNLFTPTNLLDYAVDQVQRVLPFFRYHNRWKTVGKKSIYDFDTVLNGKGYHLVEKAEAADTSLYKQETTEIHRTGGENLWLFAKIIALCQKYNVELIMYSTPSVTNWNYAKHNMVTQLANQYHLTYLDLNLTDEVKIDWNRDTYDKGDHLNYYGASQVTKYLGNYLKNTGLFTDKRSLPEYSAWNEALGTVSYMKNPPIR